MKNIAIIGAGLAGLSAAARLQQAGHRVVVFEKARGRGGRLTTKRLDYGAVDIGAQYFTAKSDLFKHAVAQWQQQGLADVWRFSPHKVENGALRSSADDTLRFVGTPGMSAICHGLSDGLDIHYSTRATGLSYEDKRWRIHCENDAEFSGFDTLIVAIPAEQARALLLPDYEVAQQIPEHTHLPCWALGLATKGKADPSVQGIFGDDLISWVSRLNKKPGRKHSSEFDDLWMLHFSPAWTQQEGKNTQKDLADIARGWLAALLSTELTSVYSYSHFWRYANLAPRYKTPLFPQRFLFDSQRQLAVIGDWCAGGRIEGAFDSAHHAASSLE